MDRLVDFFVGLCGGDFVWGGVRRIVIKVYLLMVASFFVVLYFISIFSSYDLVLIGFFAASFFLFFIGSSVFFSNFLRSIILKPDVCIDEVRHSFYLMIYTGVGGIILTLYIFWGESIVV